MNLVCVGEMEKESSLSGGGGQDVITCTSLRALFFLSAWNSSSDRARAARNDSRAAFDSRMNALAVVSIASMSFTLNSLTK